MRVLYELKGRFAPAVAAMPHDPWNAVGRDRANLIRIDAYDSPSLNDFLRIDFDDTGRKGEAIYPAHERVSELDKGIDNVRIDCSEESPPVWCQITARGWNDRVKPSTPVPAVEAYDSVDFVVREFFFMNEEHDALGPGNRSYI